jgi:hypothetical protein
MSRRLVSWYRTRARSWCTSTGVFTRCDWRSRARAPRNRGGDPFRQRRASSGQPGENCYLYRARLRHQREFQVADATWREPGQRAGGSGALLIISSRSLRRSAPAGRHRQSRCRNLSHETLRRIQPVRAPEARNGDCLSAPKRGISSISRAQRGIGCSYARRVALASEPQPAYAAIERTRSR